MSVRLSRDQPPHDEIGMPDAALEVCEDCDRPYPADGWHRCETNAIGDVPEELR